MFAERIKNMRRILREVISTWTLIDQLIKYRF